MLEMKSLLFVLVRAFEFALAPGAEDIENPSTMLAKPKRKGESAARMPLVIRAVEAA